MKISDSANRLKEILSERNMRQVELIETCNRIGEKYGVKISKSAMSQYVAGRNQPDQVRLTILAEALGVSEAWLMGYDVPRKKKNIVRVYHRGDHVTETVKEQVGYYDDETAEIAQAIRDNKEMKMLFSAAKDSDPSDLLMVANMLKRLKGDEPT